MDFHGLGALKIYLYTSQNFKFLEYQKTLNSYSGGFLLCIITFPY